MAHCTGYGNCKQGRSPCKTAWACNVVTTDGGATVSDGLPVTLHEPEGPGMAVSRWVYALGIACGVLWTYVGWRLA